VDFFFEPFPTASFLLSPPRSVSLLTGICCDGYLDAFRSFLCRNVFQSVGFVYPIFHSLIGLSAGVSSLSFQDELFARSP